MEHPMTLPPYPESMTRPDNPLRRALKKSKAAEIRRLAAMDRADRHDLIAGCIHEGHGTWISPEPAGPDRSPGSHMHEITYLQISSSGASPRQAFDNWMAAAACIADGLDADASA